ncbi:hypothetical protein DID77_03595 [Candidatus Marinamargulisbacteria bacterium SCGC AG-439-L15]|nr:hypothetical protein DID77_03595 [Candidatus Marinamargulisbacteria bacterium SCGC AG-439-L15]
MDGETISLKSTHIIPSTILVVALLLPFLTAPLFSHEFLGKLPAQQQQSLLQQNIAFNAIIKAKEKQDKVAVANYMLQFNIPNKRGPGFELMSIKNGQPIYYKTHNISSAIKSSVNKVWPDGSLGTELTGAGETVGVWDEGPVLNTHQEFTNRVTIIDTANPVSNHATHVAGTIMAAGIDANAKGMAYGASLHSYDWDRVISELSTAAGSGLLTSNHSWGIAIGWYFNPSNSEWVWYGDTSVNQNEDYKFGFYMAEARSFDSIVHSNPYTVIVKAAGNDRVDIGLSGNLHRHADNSLHNDTHNTDYFDNGGYDTVDGTSVAKNIITVGAIDKDPIQAYSGTNNVVMSSYSGWGPADDGRIKPDIVAKGSDTYSSYGTGSSSYTTIDGTSMASPAISGMIALIQEHQTNLYGSSTRMLASTIKGLLIQTANEAGNALGPDYQFGWGLANAATAIELMSENSNASQYSLIYERILKNGETIEIPLRPSSGENPIKVTLCWTDPAGTVPTPVSLDPSTKILVHDLDLRIEKTSDPEETFFPWTLNRLNPSEAASQGDNSIDNVEQIYIENPASGNYTLKITHKGTLQSDQNVSILINDYEEALSSSASNNNSSNLISSFITGPNPLTTNDSITFQYNLAQNSDVYITVYTISGHKLFEKTISSGSSGAVQGGNTVTWNGISTRGYTLINGVYLAYIVAKNGTTTSTKKFKIAIVK